MKIPFNITQESIVVLVHGGFVFLMFFALFAIASFGPGPKPRKPIPVEAPLEVPYQFIPSSLGTFDNSKLPSKRTGQRFTGSAFALSKDGHWATAKHVMDECVTAYVELQLDGGSFRHRRITKWRALINRDVAVMDTKKGIKGLPLAKRIPRINESGFFFGYPKGRANAGYATNIGKAHIVRTTRYDLEPVDAWVIHDFQPANTIRLGGNSGGPMVNKLGEVVGIVSSAHERRGRVYTSIVPALLSPLKAFSRPEFQINEELTKSNYVEFGKLLREQGMVVRIDCKT